MTRHARRAGLPPTVIALGLVSLLTDVASEMIVPLLPAFVAALGGGALAIGTIEGAAETVSALLKLVTGAASDRARARRPFVIAGYALSSLTRPLVALASASWHVVLVRCVDRVGKGVRTSPRDALIAASVPAERRGSAFGFHRAMDHAGAVLGPLVAIVLLAYVTEDVRTVFWLAAIPGVASVLVLISRVREPDLPASVSAAASPAPSALPRPDARLLAFLAPVALFTLGNASDLFLLMKASERTSSLLALPALWLGLHVVKSASSWYSGRLADRFGPLRMIRAGWIVYAVIYGALAFADDPLTIAVLCLVYGTYHGLTEGTEKAFVAALAPQDRRGAWFGWYHLTVGLLALPASVLFGWIWQSRGSASAFLTSAALALGALLLLSVLRPERERES